MFPNKIALIERIPSKGLRNQITWKQFNDDSNTIWIVGRKKEIIISGGENIYPAEIEEVLRKHPKILDAAVIGFSNDRLGEIAVAIIELLRGA